jgi:uncharacterized phiE125 gp8 family phage protein
MRIQKTTTPTTLPLTLSEAKRQLRIEESETAFDAELTSLIATAEEWVYATCHVTLLTTQYLAKFERFPDTKRFPIPAYPVASIQSVSYYDEDGNNQTITGYQSDLIQAPVAIYPAPETDWPTTQVDRIDAVRIAFTAGYGSTAASVTNMPKHLMRLLVAHWYKNKEAVITGSISKEIELAADNVMKLIRVNEFESFAV